MGKYITSTDIWKSLGEDAFTKVRSETIGTGSIAYDCSSYGDETSCNDDPNCSWNGSDCDGGSLGNYLTFSFDHDNIISGSTVIYAGGTAISSNTYSLNLDDGSVSLTSSAVTYTADYDYAVKPDSLIQDLINRSEEELESMTGRQFNLQTTSEFIDSNKDQDVYWLKNYPVTSIIGISTNTATSLTDSPTWEARTVGIGNDYLTDGSYSNMLTFIDNHPIEGKHRLKVNYVYGYSTIPDMVKELNVLLVQRNLIQSGIYKSVVRGNDFDERRLLELNAQIENLTNNLKKVNIEVI